jgi:hypothetical protein
MLQISALPETGEPSYCTALLGSDLLEAIRKKRPLLERRALFLREV